MKILIAAGGSPFSKRMLEYVKTATSGQYDVVVMVSHFHAALGNLVIGSVATKVLAHCKMPVLIVR